MPGITLANKHGQTEAIVEADALSIDLGGTVSMLDACGENREDIGMLDLGKLYLENGFTILPCLIKPPQGEVLALYLGKVEVDRSYYGYQVDLGNLMLHVNDFHEGDKKPIVASGRRPGARTKEYWRALAAEHKGTKATELVLRAFAVEIPAPAPLGIRSRTSGLAERQAKSLV